MRNSVGRRLAALVCVVLLTGAAAAQVSAMDEEQTPFRFDPIGGWIPLQQVNAYADFTVLNPWDGTAWEGVWAGVRGRAVVEPDTSTGEISVSIIPESRDIRQSGRDLFIVPLGKAVKWKIIVTVSNSGNVSMTDVSVTNDFGPEFSVTVDGSSDGKAKLSDAASSGMLPSPRTFWWNIGYLGPGDVARAELTVRSAGARLAAGFVAEGVYSLHAGFRLTYKELGLVHSGLTESHSVIVRRDPGAFRPDSIAVTLSAEPGHAAETTEPSAAEGRPGLGRLRPIVSPLYAQRSAPPVGGLWIGRVPDSTSPTYAEQEGRFQLVARGLTPNISVEDDKFVVLSGEHAEWDVEIWVANPAASEPAGWNGWEVSVTFGRNLTAAEVERYVIIEGTSVSNDGVVTLDTTYPQEGITVVRFVWDWQQRAANRFLPGSTAYIKLRLSAEGLDAGSEDLVFAEDIEMEYNPVGGSFFHEVPLHDIFIRRTAAHAEVKLSATRVDWLGRKPGVYATVATQVSASGVGVLLMEFSGFDDLTRLDGSPESIPTWYGFGADMATADTTGWVRASGLNGTSRSMDLSNPMTVTMWSKISVGEDVSSAEYVNEGVITFIMGNNQP